MEKVNARRVRDPSTGLLRLPFPQDRLVFGTAAGALFSDRPRCGGKAGGIEFFTLGPDLAMEAQARDASGTRVDEGEMPLWFYPPIPRRD